MAGPGDLQVLADEWLQACIEALDTLPVFDPTLKGAPERYFTSPGLPVWDCCEQLAIHVTPITEMATSPGGLESGKRSQRAWVNQVVLIGTVTRCIPIGTIDTPPTPDELNEASVQINADGWALWNHLHNLEAAGLLLTLCSNVVFNGVFAATPAGGCAGWTAQATVAYDGYDEVFST